jgi:hypothetical protein
MSKAEDKSRKLAETLQAALAAEPFVRAWSYISDPKLELDAAKLDTLENIARSTNPDITEESLNNLLLRTSHAIDDLLAMRKRGRIEFGGDPRKKEGPRIEQGRIKKTQDKLTILRQAGSGFISAWEEIQSDSDLKRAVELHFGRKAVTRAKEDEAAPPKKNEVLIALRARRDGVSRIDAVVNHDLPQLLVDLGQLIDDLGKARRIKKSAEHICAFKIVCAWSDNIGKVPTLSRNEGATERPPLTKFQSYLAAAGADKLLGDAIVRDTVDAVRFLKRPRQEQDQNAAGAVPPSRQRAF